jgi:hypothetical protein
MKKRLAKRHTQLKVFPVKDAKLMEQLKTFDWKLTEKLIVFYRRRCFKK